jgi:hypothetical protein
MPKQQHPPPIWMLYPRHLVLVLLLHPTTTRENEALLVGHPILTPCRRLLRRRRLLLAMPTALMF